MKLRKSYIIAAHDTLVASSCFVLSSYLRLGENLLERDPNLYAETILFGICVFGVFWAMKMFHRSWRYSSPDDIIELAKAVTLASLIFLPLTFMFTRLEGLSRSVLIINWFVLTAVLCASRISYKVLRNLKENINAGIIPETRKIPVLLIGVNDQSELFLSDTVGNHNSQYKVVGILDNDPDKRGRYIRNIKVSGDVNSLDKVLRKLKERDKSPQKIIIAPDILDAAATSRLLDIAESLGLTVGRLPKVTDIEHGQSKNQIRPIALEDLLGRPQNALNRNSMRQFISGKKILITGAGGTIGGELVRQVANFNPSSIILFDNSEHNLYLIDKELEENFPNLKRDPVIGDIRNREKLLRTFLLEKPDIVFHAAALKHVPMSELNVGEAILTNIIGTKNVAEACIEAEVKKMVMISTDKAVNPTNIMGATKRIAEKYIQGLGVSEKAGKTKMVTVRFGNVLGSTGSVIPLFRRQLAIGGPLTVTHPEVTRYFMTVREAVELVIQASATASSMKDFRSGIFVLDMGNPVLIKDLAEQMIRLAGLKPDKDIKIVYTGLRPGEKLYEELFYEYEKPQRTENDSIMLATSPLVNLHQLEKMISMMEMEAVSGDEQRVFVYLKDVLPEFNHSNLTYENNSRAAV